MVKEFTINTTILKIIRALSAQDMHIRKIADRTDINHVTIINNIRTLERLGIVEHRTIGRSKEYSLRRSKRAQRYADIARLHAKIR